MTIGELCNREVIVVQQRENIADAVKLMRQHHVGDLVVVEEKGLGRIPIGIVTDRDILIQVLGEDFSPDELTVGDVMTHEPVTGFIDDSVEDSLKLMRKNGIRRLPVVDESWYLVGILTVDDIIDLLAEEISDLAWLIRNEVDREISRTV